MAHFKSRVTLLAAAVLLLAVAGYITLRGKGEVSSGSSATIWTCSMHPQIRLDHPGRCPICGMDLTPVAAAGEAAGEALNQITLSESGGRMAGVETVELTKRKLFKVLRTVGKVEYDETAVTYVTARISGRVDEVFANFPGTIVKRGDHLVNIYSPDLLATQSELLNAYRRDRQPGVSSTTGSTELSESARRRLELWGVTGEQIEELIRRGVPDDHLVIYAPFGGTIIEKSVRPGQYVETGSTLYRLADLSRVWLILDIFESDVGWVRFGQSVDVTLEGFPEQVMTGSVAFIEPVLNEQTRTVQVRVVLPNLEGRLKPGMYAQALLSIPILASGEPGPTGLEGKYVCPMHPYVVQEAAGDCHVCRMPLERVAEARSGATLAETLAVPADAVLDTGRRQLVYVDRGGGKYELISPHLGPRAGDYFPVMHGLKEGDRVVRRGNFLLDSQFQISGKPSLLYPDGMQGGRHGDHQHGASGGAARGDSSEAAQKAAQNLARLSEGDRALAQHQGKCPITGYALGSMGVPVRVELSGTPVFLCCQGCKDQAEKNGPAILQELEQEGSSKSQQHDEPSPSP